jgi:iron complex transport system substrate-binding protein
MVIGAGSFMTEMVELAGGTNVFADASQPSITVSIETIAARNPDLMLISGEDGAVPAWASRPEWKAVRAVRERRFAYLHGSEFHRPSLRAPEAVRHLAETLKP